MSRYIDSQSAFEDYCLELADSNLLAIDTEFLREKTYYAKLCLLQVNNGKTEAIIDPLALDDLTPFGALLAKKDMVKIFHAGSQDIDILYHETGVLPTPLFDTQVAAALLGKPLQIGYGPLVRDMCGVKLAKADGFTDWSRRPLTKTQLKYAIEDVEYLPRIYRSMVATLEKSNRLSWLDEEFAELRNPAKYDHEPREMWRHVKRISSLTRQQLAIVREVAAWRETEAKRRNVPRKWVIADEAIVEIARKEPNTSARLLEVRGLASRLSHKAVNQILEAVRKGVETPQEQLPKKEHHDKGLHEADGIVDLMSALVSVRAAENGVAAPVLVNREELSKLARGHREDLGVLEGWRYQMVGKELESLLAGKLALHFDGRQINVEMRS